MKRSVSKRKKIFFIGFILAFSGFMCFAAASGDVNNDGKVDIIDALMVAQYSAGIIPSGFISANADVTGDGAVTITDALRIAQISAGIITPDAQILIPHTSWPCGMAGGIPKPESGTLVFEVTMKLDQIYNLGKTPYGQRQVIVVNSGTITSTKLNASVMSGGLDFQLVLSNGAMEIEQILVLKASDGSYIYVRSPGTAANQNDVRMVPDFEAPNSGSYSWLNTGKFAGRRIVDSTAKTMKISVYDVSSVSVTPTSTNSVTVTEPTDVKDQPWNYRTAGSTERKGNQFIVENVALAGSQSVGATKNGRNRNIIPITGGTVTGKINGKVLAAGADYQNVSNPMTIDARYLWQTNDGEVIIVRNAGPFGSLVPIFEVRSDSSYAYMNDTLYLSSDPGSGSGGVQITFYESTK